ncbi:MAG TPA: sugar phosphate isomerase/epimerase [Capsulimonadaceae bacterium]|jgi:sugar phosphate isomerase/epimerase
MPKLGLVHCNTPGSTLVEFFRWAADTGFEFVELTPPDVVVDDPVGEPSLEQAARVRKLAHSYGLRVSAFAARNDFVVLDSGVIDFQVARMRRVAEITRALDEEAVIRSEGGAEKESVPRERWADTMTGCFERCTSFLDELGVDLAIDNHGTVSNDGDVLLEVLRRVNHPRIGANLDTMNFLWYGNDLPTCNRYYRELAPFVKHTHIKDGRGVRSEYVGEVLGEGQIDLAYALACLKDAGYTGAYNAEYEGKQTEDGAGYAKCLRWMREHIL